MDTAVLSCPNCGAALRAGPTDSVVVCAYCQSTVQVTPAGSPARLPEAALSPEVEPEIERLLRAGQRIAAIKLYREHTDVSLKQAKDAVDAIGTSIGLPAPSHGAMSSWSCVIWAGALVAGFLLWMVVLVLAIEGVGYGVRLLFGDTWSAAWGEMVQVCTGFFLVFASIAGFIMWGNARISQR